MAACREDEAHRQILQQWLCSYQPQTLFNEEGKLYAELRVMAPQGKKRMSASPYANGGRLRRELNTPNIDAFALDIAGHRASPTAVKRQNSLATTLAPSSSVIRLPPV